MLQTINDQWDVSYGAYFYGWPITIYLVWTDPTIAPWMLFVFTLPIVLS